MLGNDTLPPYSIAHSKLFTSLVLLVGLLVNSVIIGSVASVLLDLGRNAAEKQAWFDRINGHCSHTRVPKQLTSRIIRYFDHLCAMPGAPSHRCDSGAKGWVW